MGARWAHGKRTVPTEDPLRGHSALRNLQSEQEIRFRCAWLPRADAFSHAICIRESIPWSLPQLEIHVRQCTP